MPCCKIAHTTKTLQFERAGPKNLVDFQWSYPHKLAYFAFLTEIWKMLLQFAAQRNNQNA